MVDQKFHQWLQSQMNIHGYSQAELARRAGITRSAINKIIIEQRNTGPEVCNALARALNLPPEEIHRRAGLLPPAPNRSILEERATYLFNQLPHNDQEDILDYIELRYNKAQKRETQKGTG